MLFIPRKKVRTHSSAVACTTIGIGALFFFRMRSFRFDIATTRRTRTIPTGTFDFNDTATVFGHKIHPYLLSLSHLFQLNIHTIVTPAGNVSLDISLVIICLNELTLLSTINTSVKLISHSLECNSNG